MVANGDSLAHREDLTVVMFSSAGPVTLVATKRVWFEEVVVDDDLLPLEGHATAGAPSHRIHQIVVNSVNR
jgi:hypothetical protein